MSKHQESAAKSSTTRIVIKSAEGRSSSRARTVSTNDFSQGRAVFLRAGMMNIADKKR